MRNSTESVRGGSSQRGMALIMVLLFLILTSALAFALLYRVNAEQKMQKSDSGNTAAFYAAEAGMEKMNADLINLFTLQAAPDWCDIQGVVAATNQPNQTYVGATYPEYAITVPTPPIGCTPPASHAQLITQGPNAGLQALIVPLILQVTAERTSGEEVRMIRNVEIAEIPVFQFGMFSETDLAFFPGGTTDLNGRVQTNQNLYLTPGGTLTLHSQIRAAGDVVRNEMPNGRLPTDSPTHTAPVYIPTQPNGCDGSKPACRALSLASPVEGSSSGGPLFANCDPAVAEEVGGSALCNGTTISGWQTVSTTNYNGMILSGSTGAKKLKLAFVQDTTPKIGPEEIIRRPHTESPTSALGASRLYNLAQIRVLLSDDPSELPATTGFQASGSTLCANPCLDPDNVRLANGQFGAAPDYTNGVPIEGSANSMMFAEGTDDISTASTTSEDDWIAPGTIPAYAQTMVPTTAPIISSGPPARWNLLDGYLRVEIRLADGTYQAVTNEWLKYGFARGTNPMTAAGNEPPTATSGTNPDGDAILVLQHLADRNANPNGSADAATASGTYTSTTCSSSNPMSRRCTYISKSSTGCSGGSYKWKYSCPAIPAELAPGTAGSPMYGTATRNNWYPINFYDPREGEWRGNDSFPTCSVNGVMNATDIDVGNLRKWLMGSAPYASGSGLLTESDTQNGYVLYFSDRRGMLANATTMSSTNGSSSGFKDGEYGFEDVINTAASSYLPNNSLDDGENVNASHDSSGAPSLDMWGKYNLGYGFGASATINQHPEARIACLSTARKNWVSGARHVVRLVDGWRGKVPTKSDGTGGFTLASENPAYVIGDYNALASEGGNAQTANSGTYILPHANSAVISDSLILLSNNFTDIKTWEYPTTVSSRTGATTYYRMAIATGKNMNYPYNSTNADGDGDFGTDGGTHNFLHYIEAQGGFTVSYLGSMVSLYYSMYNTGVHKTGGAIYSVPTRDYGFDPDFLDISKMPPGTPRFRDVVNLGFQQVF